MSKVYLEDTILTNIANQTRRLKETQDTYTPTEMVTALSTVSSTPVVNSVSGNSGTGSNLWGGYVSYFLTDLICNIDKEHCNKFFYNCTALKNLTLNFSVSPVSLFYLCGNCSILDNFIVNFGTNANMGSVTTLQSAFYQCSKLTNLDTANNWNLTSCTNFSGCFNNCPEFITAPTWQTPAATDMSGMFSYSNKLANIPIYNTQNVTNMSNMFSGCSSLTTTSVDNILQMCINATSYTGTKTLSTLGFNAGICSAATIQALPHYSDFTSAGWSIGYN